MNQNTITKLLLLIFFANLALFSYWMYKETKTSIPVPIVQEIIEPRKEIPSFAYYLKNPNVQAIKSSPFDLIIMDTENRKGKISKAEVADLVTNKAVLAYLSIGEAENYRDYWKKEWNKKRPGWIGNENPLWKGNYAIKDISNTEWLNIVKAELDKIIDAGYSGVLLNGAFTYAEIGTPEARKNMIDFVIAISAYAKTRNKDFYILVQDSEELITDDLYLKSVDGILKQDLVYSWKSDGNKGPRNPITEIQKSLDYLNKVKQARKDVLVVEYVSDDLWIDAKKIIEENKFIGYSAPKLLDTLRLKQ